MSFYCILPQINPDYFHLYPETEFIFGNSRFGAASKVRVRLIPGAHPVENLVFYDTSFALQRKIRGVREFAKDGN